MADLRALISSAHRPERLVALCLRGDLVAEYERLDASLAEARKRDHDSFSGGEARKVAAAMEKIADEMRASTVSVRLQALDKMRPLSLLAEHPPRKDSREDTALGYNQETYYTALVRESTRSLEHADGTVLDISEVSDEEWEALFDALSYKQFDNLVGAALVLNNRDVDVPFSRLASLISQQSDGDSE